MKSRLLQTFTWALVPSQPDAGAPPVSSIRSRTKVEGQSSSLAERVSRRLGSDDDLSTRQAAVTIRLAINQGAADLEDRHVLLERCRAAPVPCHACRITKVLEEGVRRFR